MGSRTPLFEKHVAANARIVDFGGWDMPIHYGSQLDEHHHVRKNVGMFDVSHMTVIDITGAGARDFLDHLLANDIRRLTLKGKALYSGMLNEDGHVIDDLIVYWNDPDFLMVVNCATREKDLAWISQQVAGFDCQITERPELAIVALQGPNALDIFNQSYPDAAALVTGLKVYQGGYFGNWFVARTGYTGEKGLEIIIPAAEVEALWQTLADAGVPAIGLGARDTLRLEAGMNLYGSDMDETVSPYAANMGSTVVLDDRQFVGSDALRAQPEGGPELIGLVMTDRGVLRAHYPVFSGDKQVGEITSGAFSPTLQHSIALARVTDKTGPLTVEIRKKRCPVSAVSTPFVRHGKQVYKAL